MDIILHAGIHKTASTYFQQEVFPVIDGVSFIPRNAAKDFNEYIINSDNFNIEQAKVLWVNTLDAYGIRRDGEQKILLSNEDYYPHPFNGSTDRFRTLARLIQLFGADVKLFIFLRRQEGLLNSLYLQYIKTGGYKAFPDFLGSKHSGNILSIEYFLFDDLVSYLHEAMHPLNFRVFLFEDFLKRRESALNEINYFITGKQLPFPIDKPGNRIANISLHPEFVGIVRRLNRVTKSYRSKSGFLPFLFYRGYMHYFLQRSAKLPGSKQPEFKFDKEQEEEIATSNQHLQKLIPALCLREHKYSGI